MNRRFSYAIGIIAAFGLIVAGATIDLHAQRGGGAGRGRPATAGQGRPATAGRPDTAGRPATTHGRADHPDGDNHPGKPTATGGKPTVSDQVARNTNLSSRLQGLLPAGTDLQKASAGFKNLGQFVAAAHVSHNLDIPFDTLKAKMTGDKPMSLGQAIHELKPAADAKTEAQKAERAANTDVKDSTRRGTSGTK
jgi:hypothetical protein